MNRSLVSLSLLALLSLASCASSGPQYVQRPITHTVTQDDLVFVQTKQPLPGTNATLYVNGLGCPLCASNLDKQLARVRRVNAEKDAGFTLVKIESN